MTDNNPREEVPLFRSWTGWYIFVIGFLIFLVILFSLFTKYFE